MMDGFSGFLFTLLLALLAAAATLLRRPLMLFAVGLLLLPLAAVAVGYFLYGIGQDVSESGVQDPALWLLVGACYISVWIGAFAGVFILSAADRAKKAAEVAARREASSELAPEGAAEVRRSRRRPGARGPRPSARRA